MTHDLTEAVVLLNRYRKAGGKKEWAGWIPAEMPDGTYFWVPEMCHDGCPASREVSEANDQDLASLRDLMAEVCGEWDVTVRADLSCFKSGDWGMDHRGSKTTAWFSTRTAALTTGFTLAIEMMEAK